MHIYDQHLYHKHLISCLSKHGISETSGFFVWINGKSLWDSCEVIVE